MADKTPDRAASSTRSTIPARLDSWKEIAAHLKRNVTTVRRWEKREGLPVHRHLHEQRDSVYAYVDELDAWWESRRNHIVQNGAINDGSMESDSDVSQADSIAAPIRPRVAPWAWLAAAVLCATTMALGVWLLSRGVAPAENTIERRVAVHPPTGMTFVDVEISPDGRHLAFTAVPSHDERAVRTLWVQRADSLEARRLPDTADASLPFWSPSSDALGFFAEGRLWTIDLAGGSPRNLAPAPDGRGGTWNDDGVIVFAPGRAGALYRVAAAGGETTAVTRLGDGGRGHVWPSFLPDSKHFTYLAHPGGRPHKDHRVFVAALDDGSRRPILSAESGVRYFGDGYLVYERDRGLFVQLFDLKRQELMGEPIAVTEKVVAVHGYPSKSAFSVSSRGTLIYRTPQSPATHLVWRDRAGRSSPLLDIPANYSEPALSPDETRIAYSKFDPEPSKRHGYGPVDLVSNLYMLERTTGVRSQLTLGPVMESGVVWSPDSKSIVYYTARDDDTTELLLKDMTDARGVVAPLATKGLNPAATSWSQDGRFLAYATFDRKTRSDVWLLPMSGHRTPIPVLQSEFGEEQGQISPDGRWLAYTSDESGRFEVWVTTLPKAITKWRISAGGGGDPRWRPDGSELFYIAADRQLMAVPVNAETTFQYGRAVALFDTGLPPHWYEARNLYDVSRDGRFLFMSPLEDDRSAPAVMILNWTAPPGK